MNNKELAISILLSALLLLTSFSVIAAEEPVIPFNKANITHFNQAPNLEQKVKGGELPPLKERLPDEPLVVNPTNKVGKYGGTITLGASSKSMWSPAGQMMAEYVLRLDRFKPLSGKTVPNIGKSWEFKDDGKIMHLHLREGMKWSDGEPVTTEDFLFWYEDVLKNQELTASAGFDFLDDVTAVDKYTLKFKFTKPYYAFINNLNSSGFSGLQGMNDWGFNYLPKHYFKKYHIKYNKSASELAQEEGFDSWTRLFKSKASMNLVATGYPAKDVPTVLPWILEERTASGAILKRNPYYFKVDTQGNQLPYINEVRITYFGGSSETHLSQIMSGQIDFDGWGIGISKFPTLKNNEEKGNYNAWLGIDPWASYATFYFNQNYTKDEVLGDILEDKQFRRALSLAINRKEINETVFLGQGKARQSAFPPSMPGFEESFANSYVNYDPEGAREILDSIGLTDEDGDGWRERPDGKNLTLRIALTQDQSFWPSVTQLVRDYWRDVGVKANMNVLERNYYIKRTQQAGNHQVAVWVTDGSAKMSVISGKGGRWGVETTCFPKYSQWFTSDGASGKEPPEKIKHLYDLASQLPFASQEKQKEIINELGEIWADNVWHVGTVGFVGKPSVSDQDLGNVNIGGPAPGPMSYGGGASTWLEQFYWKSADNR